MSERPVVQEYLGMINDMLDSDDPVIRGICRITTQIYGKHDEWNTAVNVLSKVLGVTTNDAVYVLSVGYDALHNRKEC